MRSAFSLASTPQIDVATSKIDNNDDKFYIKIPQQFKYVNYF